MCIRDRSQVYDIVAPFKAKETEKPIEGVGYNNLSHPGYPMKEFQLPPHDTLPSASLYASLNIETGPAVYDVPKKSAQLYSVPDMEKKRKRCQKKKERSKKITAEEMYISSSLSLECHYDVPRSKPKQEHITVKASLFYDQPTSLSPVPITKGSGKTLQERETGEEL